MGSDGRRLLLLHPAHLHAKVRRTACGDYSKWMEGLLDGLADFGRETFLHLKLAGHSVDHAGELAEPYYLAIGDVTDRDGAKKGNM